MVDIKSFLPLQTGFCFNNIILSNDLIYRLNNLFNLKKSKKYNELVENIYKNQLVNEYKYLKYNENIKTSDIKNYIKNYLNYNFSMFMFNLFSKTETIFSIEINNKVDKKIYKNIFKHMINDEKFINSLFKYNQIYFIIIPDDYVKNNKFLKSIYKNDLNSFIKYSIDYINEKTDLITEKLINNNLYTHICFIDLNYNLFVSQFKIDIEDNEDNRDRLIKRGFIDCIDIILKNKIDNGFYLYIKTVV